MANPAAYKAILLATRRAALSRLARRDIRIEIKTILMHDDAPERFVLLHTAHRAMIYDPRMVNAVRTFAHEDRIREVRANVPGLEQFYYAWDGATLTSRTHADALADLQTWEKVDPRITMEHFGFHMSDGVIDPSGADARLGGA